MAKLVKKLALTKKGKKVVTLSSKKSDKVNAVKTIHCLIKKLAAITIKNGKVIGKKKGIVATETMAAPNDGIKKATKIKAMAKQYILTKN